MKFKWSGLVPAIRYWYAKYRESAGPGRLVSYERCHKITKEYTHYMEKQLIARMGKEHSNDFDDKPFLELLFVMKYMNNLWNSIEIINDKNISIFVSRFWKILRSSPTYREYTITALMLFCFDTFGFRFFRKYFWRKYFCNIFSVPYIFRWYESKCK